MDDRSTRMKMLTQEVAKQKGWTLEVASEACNMCERISQLFDEGKDCTKCRVNRIVKEITNEVF